MADPETTMDKLTGKQRLFVEHYIACRFNATEAARRAGYKGTDATLGVVGHENLRKPRIKAALKEMFSEMAMDAEECLARIASHAQSDSPQALRALELVGKNHGLFADRVKIDISDIENKTDEELLEIIRGRHTS